MLEEPFAFTFCGGGIVLRDDHNMYQYEYNDMINVFIMHRCANRSRMLPVRTAPLNELLYTLSSRRFVLADPYVTF